MTLGRRQFVTPFRFHSDAVPASDMYCPDDRIYWIDTEGRVHWFKYMGLANPGMKESVDELKEALEES